MVIKMSDKQILLENLDKIHTTKMGVERIKRNLKLETDDVVDVCIKMIQDADCIITRRGKNWYAEINGCRITINAYSYTIITAHRKGESL